MVFLLTVTTLGLNQYQPDLPRSHQVDRESIQIRGKREPLRVDEIIIHTSSDNKCNMLILSTLLLSFTLSGQSLGPKAIPEELRKRVREAQTLNDLKSVANLAYAPHLIEHKNQKTLRLSPSLRLSNERSMVKLQGASAFAFSMNSERSDHQPDLNGMFFLIKRRSWNSH
ncbi:unnamed protein product [Gongylonema pulchrum]|uniref:Outer membrane efflux protein n=1 Tax=Gongylonema pulchrum TaxID=637853 RepID=A0A183EZE2_9BILA|nr:unnamed protein product [Gongylonema pulchrum]